MSKVEAAPFSTLRSYLWPIHRFELRKFLPLFLMAFFIGFNYNILRNMKDALLITAESSGAEVLPFIKVWGMLPGAILITFIYSRLNNTLSRSNVFYTMIGIFLVFFVVFTFGIYPLRDYLHPHQTADFLQEILPTGLKGFIAMFRYWTFSSFYIMSELWSSTILSMLFWGFANQVTRLNEAKRFYGLIAIGLNLAAIASGQISVLLSSKTFHAYLSFGKDAWEQSLTMLTSVVVLSGILIVIIYRWFNHHVLTERITSENGQTQTIKKEQKVKMSMRENFATLGRSKYLLYIAVIVLSYNIVINLVEVIWKDQVNKLYQDPNDYNSYMSQITTITGIISFFTSFLVSGQVIRKCGWTFTAILTPMILLITSIGFFTFLLGNGDILGIVTILGTSPLTIVVFFGSLQNCLSRAAKFTLFDSTKELAFIPLSLEDKLKGKAAIDGVGSRLGKSGGSIIHQGLLMVFSTITASAAYVGAVLLVFITGWLIAVRALGKQFNAVEASHEDNTASTAPAVSKPSAVSQELSLEQPSSSPILADMSKIESVETAVLTT